MPTLIMASSLEVSASDRLAGRVPIAKRFLQVFPLLLLWSPQVQVALTIQILSSMTFKTKLQASPVTNSWLADMHGCFWRVSNGEVGVWLTIVLAPLLILQLKPAVPLAPCLPRRWLCWSARHHCLIQFLLCRQRHTHAQTLHQPKHPSRDARPECWHSYITYDHRPPHRSAK